MNFNSFAKSAIALVVLSGAAFGANAANLTVDVGSVTAGTTFSQVIQKATGTFLDKWSFSIAAPTFAGGSISNLSISIPGLNLYNVDDLSASLYTGAGVLVQNLDTNPGSTADLKVGSGLFAPGNYYFNVVGNANGSFGGQYVFAVTTLPVPEPETYAMLLAGLGVMGAIARRKAKKQA